MSAGKGDKPRPVDGDKFRAGYDRIWSSRDERLPSKEKDGDGNLRNLGLKFIERSDRLRRKNLKNNTDSYLHLPQTVFSQPKLDGMRAVITKDGAKSRNRKPWVTIPHILKSLKHVFKVFSYLTKLRDGKSMD